MAKRLQKEYATLKKEPIEWAELELDNGNDLFCWKCKIAGPENSPYEKGIFDIKLVIKENYPFKPPDAFFVTKTYHPNILQKDGSICAEILGKDWSPQIKIEQVLGMVRQMLAEPNIDSPLEEAVAQQYRENRDAYNKTAKEWTEKYAHKKKK